ncbi:MAG TPA: alpha-ketoglutarate-dependent dioxygenase AlkB [Verrucomicrobiae bacterium]|nr:alpha-ketoglutarate-dependent dioxygenase AlkB [Verrucomicrobiae bacterium]
MTPSETSFEVLWRLHPEDRAEIRMHGRKVKVPRWQQAFGRDYRFSGQVNRALPVPPVLALLLEWAQNTIDSRLNGLLLNWYDGKLGHYIGAHRDSAKDLVPGAPIVTMSLGEQRIFRIRPWKKDGMTSSINLDLTNGTVVVMPYETNQAFTHEVPASTRLQGRRISVTARAFAR